MTLQEAFISPAVCSLRSVAYLVVDNEMHTAADREMWYISQRKCLMYDSLHRKHSQCNNCKTEAACGMHAIQSANHWAACKHSWAGRRHFRPSLTRLVRLYVSMCVCMLNMCEQLLALKHSLFSLYVLLRKWYEIVILSNSSQLIAITSGLHEGGMHCSDSVN